MSSALKPREREAARIIFQKLLTPLDSKGDPERAKHFLGGGFEDSGYGVPEGAAVNGSFAAEGTQGYFTKTPADGRKAFLEGVRSMREFFERRERANGKKTACILKAGIGGQHTPFQAIADAFGALSLELPFISGAYELASDYERDISKKLSALGAGWDQVVVIPSSKSGATDETMIIFVELFSILLKRIAAKHGVKGELLSRIALDVLHDVNFKDGTERPPQELFQGFCFELISEKAGEFGLTIDAATVRRIFAEVLGSMFFETVDRPASSRLSAFIRNSGLDRALGGEAPGFGAMFDNVGGRWTVDLHMMTFLAFYKLDAGAYWEARATGVEEVREGRHASCRLADRILDDEVSDLALLVPDEAYWFGKAVEQNWNESIWQNGFANLIAVRLSDWEAEKRHYADQPKKLVLNDSPLKVSEKTFRVFTVPFYFDFGALKTSSNAKQDLALAFASQFTFFYGLTAACGNRLMARALHEKDYPADQLDLNNLDLPQTKTARENLYLLQPFVELGKGFLKARLERLQKEEAEAPGAIEMCYASIKSAAHSRHLDSSLSVVEVPASIADAGSLAEVINRAMSYAQEHSRKFFPFLYLEGDRFVTLRDRLLRLGLPWVLQGTSDQHINYQQVLAQPRRFLPFIISFVSEHPLPGRPAVGFAKGYLHHVSAHLVRDLFAESSFEALRERGGKGLFLRLVDSEENLKLAAEAFERTSPMR